VSELQYVMAEGILVRMKICSRIELQVSALTLELIPSTYIFGV